MAVKAASAATQATTQMSICFTAYQRKM